MTVRVAMATYEQFQRDARLRGMRTTQYVRFLLEGGTFLEDEAQVRELIEDLDRRLSRIEEMANVG